MAWTSKSKVPFYVRAAGASTWETRYLPNAACQAVSFLDEAGTRLGTTCGKERFETTDGGRTWRAA
jgi:hypothetical protein